MPITRRKLLLYFIALAVALLTGCKTTGSAPTGNDTNPASNRRPSAPAKRKKLQRKKQLTPDLSAEIRRALDEEDNPRVDNNGQDLFSGIDLPPIKLEGDEDPVPYFIVFKAPVTLNDIVNKADGAAYAAIFASLEEAREHEKKLALHAKKQKLPTLAAQPEPAETKPAPTLLVDEEMIARLNELKRKINIMQRFTNIPIVRKLREALP